MLILFFTIVFIAELIVAGKLISLIKQAKMSVKEINNQVSDIKPIVAVGVASAKKGVKNITVGVGNVSAYLAKKKKDAFKIIVKALVALALLLVLRKLPNKKVLSAIDLLFALGNLLKLA